MFPSGQRFQADDATRPGISERLVVEDHLTSVNRSAKLG
jgi:hypothetical protein